MGFDKLFADLAGKPVLAWSLLAFENTECVDEIVLVGREADRQAFEQLVISLGLQKIRAIVAGGKERHHSVSNGLQALHAECQFVAVHDGARPLVTPHLITRIFDAAKEHGAVSAAAPVTDTLKRADEATLEISGSVERTALWAMQTPQTFRTDWLKIAYAKVVEAGGLVTDETSAMEMAQYPVRLLQNEEWNLKVTFPRDLPLAEAILRAREMGEPI